MTPAQVKAIAAAIASALTVLGVRFDGPIVEMLGAVLAGALLVIGHRLPSPAEADRFEQGYESGVRQAMDVKVAAAMSQARAEQIADAMQLSPQTGTSGDENRDPENAGGLVGDPLAFRVAVYGVNAAGVEQDEPLAVAPIEELLDDELSAAVSGRIAVRVEVDPAGF